MSEGQKVGHYHRILPIDGMADDCLFVIPTALLREAEMEIGDEFIALPKKGGLVIKRLKQKATLEGR